MNGIQRIEHCFQQGKVFAGYLTVGDGGPQRTLDAARALLQGGINLLELGMPFSDPIADGPVIQRACTRALQHGTTLQDIFTLSTTLRQQHPDVPLILFSYLNPLLCMGTTAFCHQAKKAGIDGVLIIDCPLEASQPFHQACLQHDIAPIYVITPSTTKERLRQLDQQGKGFLYYACRKGTTGIKSELPEYFVADMNMIHANVRLPVLVGFGISTAMMAQRVLQHAEGVVIGSLFVNAIEQGITPCELTHLVTHLHPFKRFAS